MGIKKALTHKSCTQRQQDSTKVVLLVPLYEERIDLGKADETRIDVLREESFQIV